MNQEREIDISPQEMRDISKFVHLDPSVEKERLKMEKLLLKWITPEQYGFYETKIDKEDRITFLMIVQRKAKDRYGEAINLARGLK